MEKNKFKLGFVALTGMLLSACGDTSGTSLAAFSQNASSAQVFTANLSAVNRNQTQSQAQAGTATVSIRGNQISFMGSGTGLDPSQRYVGAVYQGGSCPIQTSDVNGDGVIDAIEGASIFGQSLVDLGTNANLNINADQSGFFNFQGSGPFGTLVSPSDTLALENSIVVISNQQNLPVLCGGFVRVVPTPTASPSASPSPSATPTP